jgi:hypothetical protein
LLGFSFVAPSLIVLRGLLACGFLFLFAWSIHVLHISVDSTVFAGVYMVINLVIMAKLIYARRHVTFDPDREEVYMALFCSDVNPKDHTGVTVPHFSGSPAAAAATVITSTSQPALQSKRWNCSRVTWMNIMKGSTIETLEAGAVVANRGDKCETVSILLEGEVSYRHSFDSPLLASSVHVHSISRLGVIDAVEWVNRHTSRGPFWGINVRTTQRTRLLRIPYASIDAASSNDPMAGIPALFDAICGVQVTLILFDTQQQAHHALTAVESSGKRGLDIGLGNESKDLSSTFQSNGVALRQGNTVQMASSTKKKDEEEGSDHVTFHMED